MYVLELIIIPPGGFSSPYVPDVPDVPYGDSNITVGFT